MNTLRVPILLPHTNGLAVRSEGGLIRPDEDFELQMVGISNETLAKTVAALHLGSSAFKSIGPVGGTEAPAYAVYSPHDALLEPRDGVSIVDVESFVEQAREDTDPERIAEAVFVTRAMEKYHRFS